MKAIIQDSYGPDALEVREIDRPEAVGDKILVRVRAASIHAGDWFLTIGVPYFMRPGWGLTGPRKKVPGFDLAGTVEAVGEKVTRFRPGDEVLGTAKGSCAEYVTAREKDLVLKPAALAFEEAAAITISGVTALKGIRDAGKVQSGQKVLINGASGGVGTYAVQIAKWLGAEVTGVCSGANADLVRSIGADHVIDYTQEDFTAGGPQYDLILDNAASHSLKVSRRAVVPTGKLIPNNGSEGGAWFGPLPRILGATMQSLFVRRQGRPYVAIPKTEDLTDLIGLIEAGHVKPVIGSIYPFEQTLEAMRHVGEGHSGGKVVIAF